MTTFINNTTQQNTKASWQDLSIELLNDVFTPLTFEERIKLLYRYFPKEYVLMTSSFGTKSVMLLHLIHRLQPEQIIHFINTTYHFPETLAYRDALVEKYQLQLKELLPSKMENKMTTDEEWWKDHPRMCCAINKLAPLDEIKGNYNVWISSLMAYQTDFRARLRVFEKQGDIIKFHPLIDIDEGEFLFYLDKYQLPQHPLEKYGYGSIGCTHCTSKGSGRAGRWQGTGKTECGLHPGYFTKKKKVG